MALPCVLRRTCAVLLVVACSAGQGADAPSSAETADSAASEGEVQAVSADTSATQASTKKYSLICKNEAPLGTRVAHRTCMRRSNEEQTRRDTEGVVGTVGLEREAVFKQP
jgi:hypothetical protein